MCLQLNLLTKRPHWYYFAWVFFLSFDLGVSLSFAGNDVELLGGSSRRKTLCMYRVSSMPEGLQGEEHLLYFALKDFLKNVHL